MENFVTRSKYIPETISIIVDFADTLSAGETISGTPAISISLETGEDPNPSDILYLGSSIHDGTKVEQRFRKGLPGVIYTITWKVTSSSGNSLEKTNYLAILPSPGDVTPDQQYLYLTSGPYPIFSIEQFQEYIEVGAGELVREIWRTAVQERMQISLAVGDGSLTDVTHRYTSPPEDMQISLLIGDGTLFLQNIHYSLQESYKVSFSIGDGTLPKVIIRYTSSPENMQIFFSIGNGTLDHV